LKKVVIIGVLFLVITNSVIPISGINLEHLTTSINPENTLYVGGNGPGNYTKIQDAIDNANEGDTVYVYNGKYIENLNLNKSIDLIGKNKNTTIIYGNNTQNVINICADGVTIKGFTVKNSKNCYTNACILIVSNSNLIQGNTILESNHHGIIISNAKNNTISDNTIMYHNHYGIFIEHSKDTKILRNSFYSNLEGCISADEFNNLIIIGNTFRHSWFMGWDISLYGSICTIKRNNFYSTSGGIYLPVCSNINVTENNFINEGCKVCFLYFLIAGPLKGPMMSKNNFNGNYWYKTRYLPKPILGYFIPSFILFFMFSIQIPCLHYDWHPAQEPYDI
jgi:parallel beta-helix repeat protein